MCENNSNVKEKGEFMCENNSNVKEKRTGDNWMCKMGALDPNIFRIKDSFCIRSDGRSSKVVLIPSGDMSCLSIVPFSSVSSIQITSLYSGKLRVEFNGNIDIVISGDSVRDFIGQYTEYVRWRDSRTMPAGDTCQSFSDVAECNSLLDAFYSRESLDGDE